MAQQQKNTALLLGKGGFGVQLSELLLAAGQYDEILFLDDAAPDCAGRLEDYAAPALRAACRDAFVGLGNNALRVRLLEQLAGAGYRTPVFRHPAAVVSPSAELGAGTVVLPFAYVGAGVVAGPGCILNAGAIVDHNAVLGAGVHAAPGAVIKAGAAVQPLAKVDSGAVVRSPWEK